MRDGVERRPTQGFPSAEAKAAVVQRAPQGIIDNQPATERAVVMSTSCADGKEFCATACQDHVLPTNRSLKHSSLWNGIDGYSSCEIRYNGARHILVLRNDLVHAMTKKDA
jgi:hypothetical protein